MSWPYDSDGASNNWPHGDTSTGREIAKDHMKGGADPKTARDAIDKAVRGSKVSDVSDGKNDWDDNNSGSDSEPWIP